MIAIYCTNIVLQFCFFFFTLANLHQQKMEQEINLDELTDMNLLQNLVSCSPPFETSIIV